MITDNHSPKEGSTDREITPIESEAEQGLPDNPGIPAKRNQHLKVADPKTEQCTGRATVSEKARIMEACSIHKKEGETYDVVRLCLDLMDHVEADFFQSFKTKKKR